MAGFDLVLLFLGGLFGLLLIGVPIGFSLLLVAALLLYAMGNFDTRFVTQAVIFGANTFTLLAIPFFILAGNIMAHGGISKRLVGFVNAAVGHVRGGLGYVTIVSSVIFAGLSGSAVADAAALGALLIPMMVAAGYDRAVATALIVAAATIAPIIPPSIPMILFGVAAEVSIGRLFMAGIVPGLLMASGLMVCWYFIAKKHNYPAGQKASRQELWSSFKGSIAALVMPVIIIGGIRFGVFTPTEAGSIAVIYAVILSLATRELAVKDIPKVILEAAKITGQVMLVATAALSVAWVITIANIPREIVKMLSDLAGNQMGLLLIINAFLLMLGMVMDITPAILIFAPILVSVVKFARIDVIYFGLIMVLNLVIGLITPPVGTVLYVGCAVGGISLGQLVSRLMPFLLVLIGILLLIVFVPSIVLVPLGWFY
ncbi:MAG: TRAP transporter large permease [Bacillota bacterium]